MDNFITTVIYLRPKGGGSGGPKIMLSLSKRSHWVVKDVEDHLKNIVPSF